METEYFYMIALLTKTGRTITIKYDNESDAREDYSEAKQQFNRDGLIVVTQTSDYEICVDSNDLCSIEFSKNPKHIPLHNTVQPVSVVSTCSNIY